VDETAHHHVGFAHHWTFTTAPAQPSPHHYRWPASARRKATALSASLAAALPPTIISWSDSSITLSGTPDASTGPLNLLVGSLNALAPSYFYVNTVVQLTDSFGDQSQYTLSEQGGLVVRQRLAGPRMQHLRNARHITKHGPTPTATSSPAPTTSATPHSYTYDSNNTTSCPFRSR